LRILELVSDEHELTVITHSNRHDPPSLYRCRPEGPQGEGTIPPDRCQGRVFRNLNETEARGGILDKYLHGTGSSRPEADKEDWDWMSFPNYNRLIWLPYSSLFSSIFFSSTSALLPHSNFLPFLSRSLTLLQLKQILVGVDLHH